MLTLIHGDDSASSRKILLDEKSKLIDHEVIIFDGKNVQLEDLILACESISLISNKKVVILENLLTGGIAKLKLPLISYLSKNSLPVDILIWEDKQIDKNILQKYFSGAKVINAKIPSNIFSFLDSIGFSSKSNLLPNFHYLVKQTPQDLFFAMLVRQWRHLIIAKDLGPSGLAGLPPWQANKFIRQATVFSLEKLLATYRQLLSIDYQIKLGQTPFNFVQLLDIFFISL